MRFSQFFVLRVRRGLDNDLLFIAFTVSLLGKKSTDSLDSASSVDKSFTDGSTVVVNITTAVSKKC